MVCEFLNRSRHIQFLENELWHHAAGIKTQQMDPSGPDCFYGSICKNVFLLPDYHWALQSLANTSKANQTFRTCSFGLMWEKDHLGAFFMSTLCMLCLRWSISSIWVSCSQVMAGLSEKWIGILGALSSVMNVASVGCEERAEWKAKLSIYWLVFVPALTCGHEVWIMTKRAKSWIQAAEMSFLCSGQAQP